MKATLRNGTRHRWLLLLVAVAFGSVANAQETEVHGSDPRTGGQHPIERLAVFPDGQAWTIEDGLAWGIGGSNAVVYVPPGFVHDRGGVPPMLWALASYTRAAIIHDYLYWAQPCSRLQADNLLMIALKEAGAPWLRRQLIYRAVRLQGEAIWRRNAWERTSGWPRLNPYGHVPGNMKWPELRTKMFHEGVRDVSYTVSDDYCHYGNTRHVP